MAKNPKVKIKVQPAIVMEAEVARKIRQHARTSMKAEVCGVLIGESSDERTVVEACIAGENAAQGGAHVTFTQDTWEHIYQIKDREFPEQKIVGWYHSHPGFGVFLSEHDLFIHENFFSSPNQIAWVYDPHTDEEGCFGWIGGRIAKLSGLRFGYSQSVELIAHNSGDPDDDPEGFVAVQASPRNKRPAGPAEEPAWVKWTARVLGYLAVLFLGFALGYEFFGYRLDKFIEEQRALHDYLVVPPPAPAPPIPGTAPPAGGTDRSPSVAPQIKPAPQKGNDGKR